MIPNEALPLPAPAERGYFQDGWIKTMYFCRTHRSLVGIIDPPHEEAIKAVARRPAASTMRRR